MAASKRPRRLNLAVHVAMLPMAITALMAYVGSVLWSIRISFTSSKMFTSSDWAGMAQYTRLWETDRWTVAVQNMGVLVFVYIGAVIVLGTLMAIFIDQQVKGESWFRTIFLYPYAMSFVVTGLIWQWLFNPTMGLQQVVQQMGFTSFRLDWTVRPETAIYAIGLAMIWRGSGAITENTVSSNTTEAAEASAMLLRPNRWSMMNLAGTSLASPGPPLVITSTMS
jgi:glucose/mannose transport system permease protein